MDSAKKKKTGSLIVLGLEILVIIILHTIKINRSSNAVQQAPAGLAAAEATIARR